MHPARRALGPRVALALFLSFSAACAVAVNPPSGETDGGGSGGHPTTGDDSGDPGATGDDGGGTTTTGDDSGTTMHDGGHYDSGHYDSGHYDSGSTTTTTSCSGYATPTETAGCHSCTDGGAQCQPNGCYGGYYCKLSTTKCSPKPPGC